MRTRAVFRCLSITECLESVWSVSLGPVTQKTGKGFPENEKFWEYTPSGKIELFFKGSMSFKVGKFYYVDIEESKEGRWVVSQVDLQRDSGTLKLSAYWTSPQAEDDGFMIHGEVSFGLSGKGTKPLDLGMPGEHNFDVFFIAHQYTEDKVAERE